MTQFARTATVVFVLLAALMALPVPAGAAPAGSTFLVSRPDGNGPVTRPTDNNSGGPLAISQEGRYVAFLSPADNLAPGTDPSLLNVFVRDMNTGTTTLVNRSDGLNGVSSDADVVINSGIAITVAPGNRVADAPHDRPHVLVAFSTTATNLVDHVDHRGEATGHREELWMRDVTAGTTYLVSRASNGFPADGRSWQPSIAVGPNGPLVAFTSASTNLGATDGDPVNGNVYLREVTNGLTHWVSCAARNCQGGRSLEGSNEPSLQYLDNASFFSPCPEESACAVVAFKTADPSIIGLGRVGNDIPQIIVARALERPDGSGLGEFGDWQVVSTKWQDESVLGNAASAQPVLNADGVLVGFISAASNLSIPGEGNPQPPLGTTEAYVHNIGIRPSFTLMTSLTKNPFSNTFQAANRRILNISIGGTKVGFDTDASNLGIDPGPLEPFRAYQATRWEQAELLDRASGAGGAVGDNESRYSTISLDGKWAVFSSHSGNLGAGGGTEFTRVYRRNIDPSSSGFETLQLVSRPSGTGPIASPGSKRAAMTNRAISADGRFVAFQSDADDLSSADDDNLVNVFVRDTVSGTTTLVSRATGANGAAANESSKLVAISDDGQRILFNTAATNLGTGNKLGVHAFVRDRAAQTTTLVSRGESATGPIVPGLGVAISGDGSHAAFLTASVIDPDAANGVGHLYVRNLATQSNVLADRDNGESGLAAADEPFNAALDRDGSRVAFETAAVLPKAGGQTTGFRQIYLRDLAANTTVLVSRGNGATGAVGNGNSEAPSLNAAGDVVAFESDASNFGFTGRRQVYVRKLATNRTELVSRGTGSNVDGDVGVPANEPSFNASIDAAGDRVAFITHADNIGAVPPPEDGETLPVHGFQAYVRDLGTNVTQVVSRVNGVNGAIADPAGGGGVSLSASGDCVAFAGTGANYTDELASADFSAVRERVLRGSCGPSSVPSVGPAPEPAPPAPVAPASLSRLRMEPARFRVGGTDGGAEISFVLDAASPVTVTFARLTAGGRAGKTVGRIQLRGKAGANTVRFTGRVHGRALTPGRYRWSATPSGGQARSGRFEVLGPARPRRAG